MWTALTCCSTINGQQDTKGGPHALTCSAKWHFEKHRGKKGHFHHHRGRTAPGTQTHLAHSCLYHNAWKNHLDFFVALLCCLILPLTCHLYKYTYLHSNSNKQIYITEACWQPALLEFSLVKCHLKRESHVQNLHLLPRWLKKKFLNELTMFFPTLMPKTCPFVDRQFGS